MRKLIIIPLLFISLILSGATYYVKTGGNDANTGLSHAQAWLHCPGMVGWTGAVTLSAGDIVKFNRGDTWTSADPLAAFLTISASGTAGNYISYKAYGTGARPILNISADKDFPVITALGKSYIKIDSLEISHYNEVQDQNAQDGIFIGKDATPTVPHDWVITNCVIHEIPNVGIYAKYDAYNIVIGNTAATVTATTTAYSNNIYNCGYGAIILNGRNPVTNYSNYDVYYNYIHDINAAYTGVNSYCISFTMWNVGAGQTQSDGWPVYCTARYNYIKENQLWEGIETHGGEYYYFLDNYVSNCGVGITAFTTDDVALATAILDHCYIQRNIIENSTDRAAGDYNFILVCGENTTYRSKNVFIENNSCFYTSRPASEASARGIYVYNCDTATISGNKIYNGPLAFSAGGLKIGLTTNLVKNITVKNNWVYQWGRGVFADCQSFDGNIDINCNIVYTNEEAFYGGGGGTMISGANLTLYNNVFLENNLATNAHIVEFTGITTNAGSLILIKNNVIGFNVPVWGYYITAPGTINGTLTVDYNIYWNSSAAFFYHGGGAKTLDQWVALGFDTHSPNGVTESLDPLFRGFNMYNHITDFDLKTGSPAINVGTDVGLTHDRFGFQVIGNPDIGAIEYRSQRLAGVLYKIDN